MQRGVKSLRCIMQWVVQYRRCILQRGVKYHHCRMKRGVKGKTPGNISQLHDAVVRFHSTLYDAAGSKILLGNAFYIVTWLSASHKMNRRRVRTWWGPGLRQPGEKCPQHHPPPLSRNYSGAKRATRLKDLRKKATWRHYRMRWKNTPVLGRVLQLGSDRRRSLPSSMSLDEFLWRRHVSAWFSSTII